MVPEPTEKRKKHQTSNNITSSSWYFVGSILSKQQIKMSTHDNLSAHDSVIQDSERILSGQITRIPKHDLFSAF